MSTTIAVNGGARSLRWWFVSGGLAATAVLCSLGVAGQRWWQNRSEAPAGEVVLHDGVQELPGSSLNMVVLRLPKAGRLQVRIERESGKEFSAYLATRGEGEDAGAKPRKPNEFRLLREFTGEKVGNYLRSAPVAGGEYLLTLVNSAAEGKEGPLRLRVVSRFEAEK